MNKKDYANVLNDPAFFAPSEGVVAEQQYTSLYLTLPNANTFRLGEISPINKEITDEIEHYRLVLKKYKKIQSSLHYTVAGFGVVTTAMSSGAVASALTGIGVLVSVPLGIVGAVCSTISAGLAAANKIVEKKVNKHAQSSLLTSLEREKINSLVSQTIDNNRISDEECRSITKETETYCRMKNSLHNKVKNATPTDLEKCAKRSAKKCGQKLRQPAPL